VKSYNYCDLVCALRACGLKQGDIALVSTELFSLGCMEGLRDRQVFYNAYVQAFREVLGPEGTLVVNSYSFQVGRMGIPYEHEKTPCTTGAFSQHVLTQPDCIRSLHPVFSVAALGAQASRICCNVSRSNYGAESPVDRMLKAGAKAVRLGLGFAANVFLHYAEAVYGVPYMYNKVFDVEVFEKGRPVEGPFMAVVRYLDLDLKFDFSKIQESVGTAGVVKSSVLGAGQVNAVTASDYVEIAIQLLKKDPYAFLMRPPSYTKGRHPFDGITKGRDGIS